MKRKKPELPTCLICLSTVSLPVVMCGGVDGCQKSFHEACIAEWIACNPTCPHCKQDYNQVPNRTLTDLLEGMEQPCVNKKRGCSKFLPYKERHNHQAHCKYREVRCTAQASGCSWVGEHRYKSAHDEQCIHVKFGVLPLEAMRMEQRIDEYAEQSERRIASIIDKQLARLESSRAGLQQMVSTYGRLRDLFNPTGTKQFLLQFKTQSRLIRVNDQTHDLTVHFTADSRRLSVGVQSGENEKLPVAVVAVVFLMNDKQDFEGDPSAIYSGVLHERAQIEQIYTTQLTERFFAGSNPLHVKLSVKVF